MIDKTALAHSHCFTERGLLRNGIRACIESFVRKLFVLSPAGKSPQALAKCACRPPCRSQPTSARPAACSTTLPCSARARPMETQAHFYFGIVRRKADTAAHSFSSGRLNSPPNVLILFFISQDDGMGEIVTLDALDALREECVKLGNAIHASSDRIFQIQQELSNPNVFSLPTRTTVSNRALGRSRQRSALGNLCKFERYDCPCCIRRSDKILPKLQMDS